MFSKKKQLTADDMPWSLRARFYEEAINQMPSGVDISQVLENLKKSLLRRGRRKQALMIYDLSQRLHGGSSIVNALGSSVEGMERSILVAGEKVGAIVEAMERALALHARMSAMRAQVWSRMFAPVMGRPPSHGPFPGMNPALKALEPAVDNCLKKRPPLEETRPPRGSGTIQ